MQCCSLNMKGCAAGCGGCIYGSLCTRHDETLQTLATLPIASALGNSQASVCRWTSNFQDRKWDIEMILILCDYDIDEPPPNASTLPTLLLTGLRLNVICWRLSICTVRLSRPVCFVLVHAWDILTCSYASSSTPKCRAS